MKGKQIFHHVKSLFPPLKSVSNKGQNGRIGVIGGSYQFTGAPYYSAISSLKIGSDLAHVFCSKSSASAIKSYSPQLIVHPVFISEQQQFCKQEDIGAMVDEWLDKIKKWQKAIYSWVIGPGLGRDKYMNEFFPKLVKNLPSHSVVVFDADGIYYLCQHPELFEELKRLKAIITPNKKELLMIENALKMQIQPTVKKITSIQGQVTEFEHQLDFKNFTLFVKGEKDIIFGPKKIAVGIQGGFKRCGGIGDILSGAVATCAYWNFQYGPALASSIVRMATQKAYAKQGRGLTAPKIIDELAGTVKYLETPDAHL